MKPLPLQHSIRNHSLLRLISLFMVIVIASNDSVAEAITPCSKPSCLYFSFVAVAPPVRVNKLGVLRLRSADHRIIGDIVNNATYPVYNVIVTVTIQFDIEGQSIEVVTSTTTLPATLPGQLNPFGVFVPFQHSRPFVYKADAVVSSWSLSSTQVYRPATIVFSNTLSGTGTAVYAEIRNDQAQALKNVQAAAWSLGGSNGVITDQVAAQLAPGETTSFTAGLDAYFNIPTSSINIVAQGVISP